MVLLIDNYDSFSYNLVQLIGELTDGNIKVVRNDEITIDEIRKMNPESIIISPGPGKPEDAGICEDVHALFRGGFQGIGKLWVGVTVGGEIFRLFHLYHKENVCFITAFCGGHKLVYVL